jgi:hypothetical protein
MIASEATSKKDAPMSTSINIPDLLTIVYVLVDDWYQAQGQALLKSKPGAKPTFSDSEMLTLMLTQEIIPYPGETQFIEFMRANYRALFPGLVDQSQFNRRARNLRWLMEAVRQDWVVRLGVVNPTKLLVDTKPVPVRGYTRSKKHSDFAGRAAYGYCAARQLHYFGYKLVMLTTLDGLPLLYDLVPANWEERDAADVLLQRVRDCDVFGDRGFLGHEWQASVRATTDNRVWTVKRANQDDQNPPEFDQLLRHVRERIEGVFHRLQNTGRNLERLLAKTVHGLSTRVIVKVTALVLKILLRRCFAIDIQTFQVLSNSH